MKLHSGLFKANVDIIRQQPRTTETIGSSTATTSTAMQTQTQTNDTQPMQIQTIKSSSLSIANDRNVSRMSDIFSFTRILSLECLKPRGISHTQKLNKCAKNYIISYILLNVYENLYKLLKLTILVTI